MKSIRVDEMTVADGRLEARGNKAAIDSLYSQYKAEGWQLERVSDTEMRGTHADKAKGNRFAL